MNIPTTVFFVLILFLPVSMRGQDGSVSLKMRVINGETRQPLPNAVVAVYSKNALYSTNSDGFVRLTLAANDSVRIVMLGFSSETYRIDALRPDSAGIANMAVYPVSYNLKEVTVKGYRGILDPMMFPHREEENRIDLHLPSNIGNKISKLPPPERLLFEDPSIFTAVLSPLSSIYSVFNSEQRQIRQLRSDKAKERILKRLDDYFNREAIALMSGFEGEQLDRFIMYCNVNINIHPFDTGASVTLRMQELLERYRRMINNKQ